MSAHDPWSVWNRAHAQRAARQQTPVGMVLAGNVNACEVSGGYLLTYRGGTTTGNRSGGVGGSWDDVRAAATDAAHRHGYTVGEWRTTGPVPGLGGETVHTADLFAAVLP